MFKIVIKMNENNKLPPLPGFVINKPKQNHHLPHRWNYINGTNIIVENEGKGKTMHRNTLVQTTDLFPSSSSNLPDWIAFDRKILCFTAYFREDLQETYTASYQIRRVKILFHLEDGTIQIVEPRTDNSGISQGCIVSKQHVPRSKLLPNEYLSVLDLNVQRTVKIFDRLYTITDCDAFTKKFLNGAGINVPESIELPSDPTHIVRQRQKYEAQPKRSKMCHENKNKLGKFLKFGTSCLKFTAYWDDRQSIGGDIRDLILYFYPCDDTIQINEINDKGKSSTMYKRQKLPKKINGPLMVGQKSNYTVLNVLGRDFMQARYVQDRLNLGRPDIEYYADVDLRIGETIDVLGRNVVLTDCDDFTKRYYREKFGIEEFISIERPKSHRWRQEFIEREIPPYNGWGSMADSEANCLSLIPKPPHRDMTKFIKLDRCNLRFKARMISNIAENGDRLFVITYYLSDDTISVYEIGGRNSGFSNGDFYKRAKFDFPTMTVLQFLYIGATIHLKGFDFKLIDADEFTLKFMESHPFEYPMSNINSIMSKVRAAIEPIYKKFVAKYLANVSTTSPSSMSKQQKMYICFNTMRKALNDLLGNTITEHEVITFLRFFSVVKSSKRIECYNRYTVQALVGIEFNRHLWDDAKSLRTFLYDLDPNCLKGYLPKEKLRSIVIGCRLPVKDDLINMMFSVLNQNENGKIEVEDFLRFIDSCKDTLAASVPKKFFDVPESNQNPELIDWSAFIGELGLEEQLIQGVE